MHAIVIWIEMYEMVSRTAFAFSHEQGHGGLGADRPRDVPSIVCESVYGIEQQGHLGADRRSDVEDERVDERHVVARARGAHERRVVE